MVALSYKEFNQKTPRWHLLSSLVLTGWGSCFLVISVKTPGAVLVPDEGSLSRPSSVTSDMAMYMRLLSWWPRTQWVWYLQTSVCASARLERKTYQARKAKIPWSNWRFFSVSVHILRPISSRYFCASSCWTSIFSWQVTTMMAIYSIGRSWNNFSGLSSKPIHTKGKSGIISWR